MGYVNHCFTPHRHEVLTRGFLDQSVRDCPVGLFLGVPIVNFLSHREESDLHRTIIFLPLKLANRCLTLMFTTDCYLRGHVSLDCKSPEPQVFGVEETLGILFVPTTRVFPDKVYHRNCTEE